MKRTLTFCIVVFFGCTGFSDPLLYWGSDLAFNPGGDAVLYTNGLSIAQDSNWLVELVNMADDTVLSSTTNGFQAGAGTFFSAVDGAAWYGLTVKTIIYDAPTKQAAGLFATLSQTTTLSWSSIPSIPATFNYNAGAVGAGDWQPMPVIPYYFQWMGEYSLTETNVLFDSDFDGLNNLVEYALGGDPTSSNNVPSVLPILTTVNDGGFSGLEYTYRRRRDYVARNLTYGLELTGNLATNSWQTNGYTVVGTAVIDSAFETVTNRISSAELNQQFIRLEIGLSE